MLVHFLYSFAYFIAGKHLSSGIEGVKRKEVKLRESNDLRLYIAGMRKGNSFAGE